MFARRFVKAGFGVVGAVIVAAASGAVLSADHSWGPYHWARTTSSFDLTVINSTTSDWDGYVIRAVNDWSASDVLNLVEDPNGSTDSKDRRQCRAPSGAVRICNLAYGYIGWLGIAGITIDANGHIVKGYTKLNDSYFSAAYYNTDAWKQSVTCQELGHNIGLDHQDEDFENESFESCMDYQDPPYPYPNQHDYDQLEAIYGQLDDYDSYADAPEPDPVGDGGGCNAPAGKGCNKGVAGQNGGDNGEIGWGISIGRRGQQETFMRIDPDGTRHITLVRWVDGH
jgi:hypothetical protein